MSDYDGFGRPEPKQGQRLPRYRAAAKKMKIY